MVPDIDTKLNAVTIALRDIIRPAVDPKNASANDQLKLVLGTINIIRSHIGMVNAYEVAEARYLAMLIKELNAIIEKHGGSASVLVDARQNAEKGLRLANDSMTFTSVLQESNRSLRDSVKVLIDFSAEIKGSAFKEVQKLILRKEEEHLFLERAWVAGHGFEDTKSLPPIAEAISVIGNGR